MQLCINKAWIDTVPVMELTKRCAWISSFFNNNTVARTIFNEERTKLGKKVLAFLTPNVTRWNSKYNLVERVVELSDALEPTANRLVLRKGVKKEEMIKFMDFRSRLFSAAELAVLGETTRLLKEAASFTHWAGGLHYSMISQIYHKAHNLLPKITSFNTEAARSFHTALEAQIKKAWPLDDISDGMLLSVYFNPACGDLEIWDRTSAIQGPEQDTDDSTLQDPDQDDNQDVDQDFADSLAQTPAQASAGASTTGAARECGAGSIRGRSRGRGRGRGAASVRDHVAGPNQHPAQDTSDPANNPNQHVQDANNLTNDTSQHSVQDLNNPTNDPDQPPIPPPRLPPAPANKSSPNNRERAGALVAAAIRKMDMRDEIKYRQLEAQERNIANPDITTFTPSILNDWDTDGVVSVITYNGK
ncbi:hypothetical protein BGX33_001875, partial [Mortierella sp. NVP41]